jgi:hypothetical protein
MLKHLKRNPIALLALFVSLGGTSYAANTVVAPPPTSLTPTYGSVFWHTGSGPLLEVTDAANMTRDNVSLASDNTVCLDRLKTQPRNVQVTGAHWYLVPKVVLRPTTGLCAGKQVRISVQQPDGYEPYFGSFFVSVQS